MSKEDNGGPAFPSEDHDGYTPGMSLRDYFAAKAMQSLIGTLTAGNTADVLEGIVGGKRISKAAFMYADAMLKARDQ